LKGGAMQGIILMAIASIVAPLLVRFLIHVEEKIAPYDRKQSKTVHGVIVK
jgi:hypothetical protein